MFDLTPSERKGALVLLALVALGAVSDLLQCEPRPAPAPAELPAPATTLATTGAPAAPAVAAPLDLNSATEADLDRLPGIGPVLAARIVAHRAAHGPFRTAEDLLAVPGIGPKLFERLAPRVTAGAPVAPPRAPLQIARPTGK